MSAAKVSTIGPVHYTNEQIVTAATGHWGEVAQEIKPAEPYRIDRPDADPIVILPLTRRRRRKMKAAQAAYLMLGAQLAEAQRDDNPDQATITRISKVLDEAEYEYDAAVFGDAVDEVMAFFEDLQEEFWDSMYQDVHDKLINRVEPPEDVCSKCGQKIGGEEDTEVAEDGQTPEAKAGGKEPSSSTSSSGSGPKSKATSAAT